MQQGGIWLNSFCINGSIRDAFGSHAWNKLYNCPQNGRTTRFYNKMKKFREKIIYHYQLIIFDMQG